ncbi:uncharacterized protein LOC135845661 [Planococcus citri]|uniref:uncharacterized protein LOC135845661 n=1 Tax=Planococcus citri TaxID=170843 RepID=UPI0031F7A965
MIAKIFLICSILPFIKAFSFNENDLAKLGQDRFCFFAYSTRTKVSTIQQIYPNAERVGVARLPYHRLDFNYYLEEVKGSIPTIVPDCGYEVWGAIYTIPINDLELVLSKGTMAGNQRVFGFVQKIIETYSNGNLIYLKCNAFQQIDLPEKFIYGLPFPKERRPSRGTLDRMIDAYTDAGLPKKYIQEISMIPTTDNNLGSLPHTPIVVAPDSLVVAPGSTVVAQNKDASKNDDDD